MALDEGRNAKGEVYRRTPRSAFGGNRLLGRFRQRLRTDLVDMVVGLPGSVRESSWSEGGVCLFPAYRQRRYIAGFLPI